MSADASIELTWADGTYKFRLPIGQLRELQDKCRAGPPEILDRLTFRKWLVDDVRETIRLGLIGGGKTPTDALVLVIRYVDDRPLMENAPVAQSIMIAALVGVPGDQPGKRDAGAIEATTPGSASEASTEPALH